MPPRLRLSISGVTFVKSTFLNSRSIFVDKESLALARSVIFSSPWVISMASISNPFDFELKISSLSFESVLFNFHKVFLKFAVEGFKPKT